MCLSILACGLCVLIPVIEHFPQGVHPGAGQAFVAEARDAGHGLHLEFELVDNGAPCPLDGAA